MSLVLNKFPLSSIIFKMDSRCFLLEKTTIIIEFELKNKLVDYN